MMKVVAVLIIGLLFNINILNSTYTTIDVYKINNSIVPNSHSRIERLIQDESSSVSEKTKTELIRLKEKIEKFEVLTQEEVEFIRQCELDVIRTKLGDAQFEEYCKLIEKREGDGEFLQPDRFRLYELEKQLNNIR